MARRRELRSQVYAPTQALLSLSPRPPGPSAQAGSEPDPSCTTGPGYGQVSIGRHCAPHPLLSVQRSPPEDLLPVNEGVEPALGPKVPRHAGFPAQKEALL